MTMAPFRTGMLRASLMAAALLALAYAILVPQGFMTARGADGAVRIVLCSGDGPLTLAQPEGAHHAMPGMASDQGDHGPAHGDHRCPFAGHAAPSTIDGPMVAMVDPAPFLRPAYLPPRPQSAPGRGMSAPPPPSRAPPLPSA